MLKKIFNGYYNFIKSSKNSLTAVLSVIFFLLSVIIVSILIILPLWFLATNYPAKYSSFVLIISLVTILFLIIFRIRVFLYVDENRKNKNIKISLYKILSKILFIILLIIQIYLFTYNLYIGIIYMLGFLLLYGYIKFVYKR